MAKSSHSPYFVGTNPVETAAYAALGSGEIPRSEMDRLIKMYAGYYEESLDELQGYIRAGKVKVTRG